MSQTQVLNLNVNVIVECPIEYYQYMNINHARNPISMHFGECVSIFSRTRLGNMNMQYQ